MTAARAKAAAFLGAAVMAAAASAPVRSAGDLSRQVPIEVVVELGSADRPHAFGPSQLRFETGKLYKLMLKNRSAEPHYFTSQEFTQRIFTRKAQVNAEVDGKTLRIAEIKGAIRDIEVFPGQTVEWWFVPVATGRMTDLRCGVMGKDGVSHAERGMTGEIVIE
jgi:uncharacterized cupredoxin-like copper-binding protein